MDIQDLATQASTYLTTGTRDNGDSFIKTIGDDVPEWFTDLIYTAHMDCLPNDYAYTAIDYALDQISEDGEDANAYELNTYDSLSWFDKSPYAQEYCDNAMCESHIKEVLTVFNWAMCEYYGDVLQIVMQGLNEQLEVIESEQE